MSVYGQLGNKNASAGVLGVGFTVLSEVTQTRDEDIRQALLEHIEQEAEKLGTQLIPPTAPAHDRYHRGSVFHLGESRWPRGLVWPGLR